MRKIIGCDLDDVLWNFVGELLNNYNRDCDDGLTLNDITEWDIHKFLKPECSNIFKYANEELLSNLKIPVETKEVLIDLINDESFDLKFVTSCKPEGLHHRKKALLSNLGDIFVSEAQLDKMIFCMPDKSLFAGDFLIDDCHENVSKGEYCGILIDKPWNVNFKYPDFLRADNLKEAVSKIKEISIMRGKVR